MTFFHPQLGVNFRNQFASQGDGFAVLMVRPSEVFLLWKEMLEASNDLSRYNEITSSRPNHIAKRGYYEKKLGSGETIEMPFVARRANGGLSITDGQHRLIVFEKAAKKTPDMLVPLLVSTEQKEWLVEKLRALQTQPPARSEKENILDRIFRRRKAELPVGIALTEAEWLNKVTRKAAEHAGKC